MRVLRVCAFALTLATAAGAATVWDYGPTSGAIHEAWANTYDFQSFAEKIEFSLPVTLTGYEHFGVTANSFAGYRLRLWADNGGAPGTLLLTQLLTPASSTYLGNVVGAILHNSTPLYQLSFALTPIDLSAGTPYWIGMTTELGQGELGQWGIQRPGDGRMAAFQQGDAFSHFTGDIIGDQMFQLLGNYRGDAVPEPSTLALSLAGLLALAVSRISTHRRRPTLHGRR